MGSRVWQQLVVCARLNKDGHGRRDDVDPHVLDLDECVQRWRLLIDDVWYPSEFVGRILADEIHRLQAEPGEFLNPQEHIMVL